MHILETTVEGHVRGIEVLQEILPWLRETTGFRGVLRLATPDRSRTVVITLWATEAAMLESSEVGRNLGALAAEASFVANRLRERGILLGTDGPLHNVVKIRPPMPFTIGDADLLVDALGESLGSLV